MSAYAAREIPSLDEEYDWHWNEDEDKPVVIESDVHDEDAILAADREAEEERGNQRAHERCLPGCPHHGFCERT